jgi:hypothetical protein
VLVVLPAPSTALVKQTTMVHEDTGLPTACILRTDPRKYAGGGHLSLPPLVEYVFALIAVQLPPGTVESTCQ